MLRQSHDLGWITVVSSDACTVFGQAQQDHVLDAVVHHCGERMTTEQFANALKDNIAVVTGGARPQVNWPFTLVVILPSNHLLKAAPRGDDSKTRQLLVCWGHLHVRIQWRRQVRRCDDPGIKEGKR